MINAGLHWVIVSICLWAGLGLIVALSFGRAASMGEPDDERRGRGE